MLLKTKSLQKLRTLLDKTGVPCERDEDDLEDGSENSRLLLLMARHTQLQDLLHGHHLIGGYDIGVYLETYNLEMNLGSNLRICRHNIPPFIPLERLVKQSNMQTDVRAFLYTLSQYLNAYVGRKQQLHLIKELHSSVQVMESNTLYTILVLMFTIPGEKAGAALCTLEYADHTRCLPNRVNIDNMYYAFLENVIFSHVHACCFYIALASSPQWKKNHALFLETPVHTALVTIKKTSSIA
ncbi:centromere protein O-like [Salvelinus alpinus]